MEIEFQCLSWYGFFIMAHYIFLFLYYINTISIKSFVTKTKFCYFSPKKLLSIIEFNITMGCLYCISFVLLWKITVALSFFFFFLLHAFFLCCARISIGIFLRLVSLNISWWIIFSDYIWQVKKLYTLKLAVLCWISLVLFNKSADVVP